MRSKQLWLSVVLSLLVTSRLTASTMTTVASPLPRPVGVTASSGDREVMLAWQPSAGATSYIVYRKTGAEAVFSELATVAAPPYLDAGLTNGQRYYYRFRAVAGTLTSVLSTTVSARPLPPRW